VEENCGILKIRLRKMIFGVAKNMNLIAAENKKKRDEAITMNYNEK